MLQQKLEREDDSKKSHPALAGTFRTLLPPQQISVFEGNPGPSTPYMQC
jgi:hypothetical protein